MGVTERAAQKAITSEWTIYRRYSEFFSLHQRLGKEFPLERFPPFPAKILFRRSQVRGVAEKRMMDLNAYVRGLLNMRANISGSEIVTLFFKPTMTDLDDDEFNRRLSLSGASRRPPSILELVARPVSMFKMSS